MISAPAAPARFWWIAPDAFGYAHTALHEDMHMARPLWAEQHPDDLVARGARGDPRRTEGRGGRTGDSVRGIGLSGQMHGLVVLDDENQVIRPSLIWCDQRSQQQVDYINPKSEREKVLEYTANPVLTGFTLPKLLWVRDEEPRNFERVRKILLPKDYIRFRLTGEFATEVSDASGTAFFDVVNGDWAYGMMDALGLDRSNSAESIRIERNHRNSNGGGGGIYGIESGYASGWRRRRPGGQRDRQRHCRRRRSLMHRGHVRGRLCVSEGACLRSGGAGPYVLPCDSGHWHVMGVTQGAGLSLQWFRNALTPGTDYDDLTAEATLSPRGAQGLFWLPYLMGERTPHLDAAARGAWVGLTAKHQRSDLIRAILEGVCYSQRDCLEIIAGFRRAGDKGEIFRRRSTQPVLAPALRRHLRPAGRHFGNAGGIGLSAQPCSHSSVLGEYNKRSRGVRGGNQRSGSERTDSRVALDFYERAYQVYRSLYPALKASFQVSPARCLS